MLNLGRNYSVSVSVVTRPKKDGDYVTWRGVSGGVIMMWARGISEFGAVVILADHSKITPVLVYERFEGFGLEAAQPVALLLILAALIVFILFRLTLLPETKPD